MSVVMLSYRFILIHSTYVHVNTMLVVSMSPSCPPPPHPERCISIMSQRPNVQQRVHWHNLGSLGRRLTQKHASYLMHMSRANKGCYVCAITIKTITGKEYSYVIALY